MIVIYIPYIYIYIHTYTERKIPYKYCEHYYMLLIDQFYYHIILL